ncbi:SMI1/KNR4 family protein [Paenibacillus sonchi]|uniref:SMI1/KNR4 family protein n=1 Tax=Paenibacillus sonchi TaxID=373687 RepID=UPI001E5EB405|nr:SMI1/KNR4 family protein [Paenibacillus sonchi]MCE3200953.1 SMI1/KNR4 family protein [Paenibacillus sonchi]
MTRFTETNGPLSMEQIEKFESKHGISLPDQYKGFLQEFNGGRPVPKMFKISDEQGPDIVRLFFGIGDMYGNLDENIKIYEDRLPIGFVPIGNDPGGNVICIGTDEEFAGKIYFWDHEEEPEDPDDMSNVYLLANSFSDFLEQMYENPDE